LEEAIMPTTDDDPQKAPRGDPTRREQRCANPACLRRDRRAGGRCQACYDFFRRHGRDITAAEMRRRRPEQLCRICHRRPVLARYRCRACYTFWRRTGRERLSAAERAHLRAGLCRTCGQRPPFRDDQCRTCYAQAQKRRRDDRS
jgi:hypothetical protein